MRYFIGGKREEGRGKREERRGKEFIYRGGELFPLNF